MPDNDPMCKLSYANYSFVESWVAVDVSGCLIALRSMFYGQILPSRPVRAYSYFH